MFEKRKVHSFRYSDALTLLKEDENRLKILIEKEIIHQNGNFVELDARFLDFFELLLEANEEINTATVEENIEYLHEPVSYTHLDVYKRQVPQLLLPVLPAVTATSSWLYNKNFSVHNIRKPSLLHLHQKLPV